MTALGRWLRFDESSWARFARLGTLSNAAFITLGSYALLAFDRFGMQGLTAPRAPVRMVLAGLYGWLGLSVAIWFIARAVLGSVPSPSTVIRLVGRAHIPLLFVAFTIGVLSVSLQVFWPARWLTWFSVAIWMPAMMVAATRTALPIDTRKAVLMAIGPYAAWLVIVGRYLELQVGHLL